MNTSRRSLPRRSLTVILALLGSLVGASSALGVTISGTDGQTFASPPSFTITANPMAVGVDSLSWTLTGPATCPGAALPAGMTSLDTEPLGSGTGSYTLFADECSGTASLGSATRTFQIDATPPAAPTVSAVPSPSNNRNPVVSWSSPEAGLTYQYTLDGGGPFGNGEFASVALFDLGDGTHTFSVVAIDGVGNQSSPSNQISFSIDGTPPAAPSTPVISGTNPTASATPTFSWTGEAGGTYEWQILLNGVLAQAGTSVAPSVAPPTALATSALNAYSIQVRQIDGVGNIGAFSTPLAFTVDLTPPTGGAIAHTPVANQVAGFTRAATAGVTLTAGSADNLAGAITYALTTAATPAPAAAAFGALTTQSVGVAATNGAVTTVFLWARDAVGNISPAPVASTTITFDNQPPTVLATSFPVPGTNATTAFGPLANVQINFSEPVQTPNALIRMCVNPCGLALAATVTYSEVTGPIAILDPAATLGVGTTYAIELPSVRDRAGNLLTGPGSTTWTFTTSADGTPPAGVTGLAAVAGIGQVGLKWRPPTDADLARITVLRSTVPPASAGDGTAARFSLPGNASSFTDVALTPGVTYHYAVYAEDAVGNPSVLARAIAVPKAPLVPLITGKPKPPKGIFDKFMKPKRGKVLGTLRPILRWRRNPAAQLYNIQILDLNTNRKVVSAFPRKPAYRVPPKRLKAGHRYAWRVWAYRGKRKGYVKVPMTTWFDTGPRAK
jgi:hypothetical protein